MQEELEKAERTNKELEEHMMKHSQQIADLMEANNTLSARTLSLAAEPEAVRMRMESQLSELRQQLKKSEEEVDAMRMSEQTQRVALLDELNTMQTENGQLREQLRAERGKNVR